MLNIYVIVLLTLVSTFQRVFHPSAILFDILETIVCTEKKPHISSVGISTTEPLHYVQAPDLSVYMVCDEDWGPFITYKVGSYSSD